MPERSEFFRRRAPRYLGVAAVFTATALVMGSASARDADELASALGSASGAVVRTEDIRWEPSGGSVADLVFGRSVLFLGSEVPGGPRDLYRARVRVSPEGHVLDVSSGHNLTSTPLGGDHALVVRGAHAAYATFAFGQEQSVTALDLAGEGAQNVTKKLHDRVMAFVTNVQQTGGGDGIGRIDITLDQPALRVGLAMGEAALDIELADDERSTTPTRTVRLDFDKGELTPASAVGLHADAGRHLPKRLVFWAVDTVRAVTWIGPAPIAWLEEKTFAVRDTLKQTAFKVTSGSEALAHEGEQTPPPSVLDTTQASADLGHWPPASIHSMWKTPEPGEGEWELPKQPWIKKLPLPPGCSSGSEGPDAGARDANACDAAPSPFYRTFVRPDEERPYAKVLLLAMDMRQLDLEMEAGNEDPKPLTGPPGTGRIPRDPAVYTRIAGAFNGGFKTEHGSYGMMLKKRVLLPPVAGIATVIVTKDGRVGMGSWGTNREVGGIVDVPTADILSFRQNLDPLLDNDKVNPLGRTQWGFTLPGTSMQTERSGICVNGAGHLMYAWGDDVSATTLGKAMKMAGCIYGMHLDMNPHHTGFLFTNITELKGRNYKSELLSTQMEIDTARYIEYAPKDFFYLTMHDPTPPSLDASARAAAGAAANGAARNPVVAVSTSAGGGANSATTGEPTKWEPDPGVQPAPSWMAGLWRTNALAGSSSVEVLDIEPARATFRVRAGTAEPDAKTGTARAHELSDDDAHRVLFALTLGTAEAKRGRGLITDGRVALPMSNEGHGGALVTSEDGQLSIATSHELGNVAPHTDVVELPLLVDEGKPVSGGSSRVNAALGITAQGRIYVARATGNARAGGASADDVATLLIRAGCTRAVVLDRGAGGHGAMYRAGTSSPPRSRYEDTTLYAMGRALLPRGFRFESEHPVEPPPPKKK